MRSTPQRGFFWPTLCISMTAFTTGVYAFAALNEYCESSCHTRHSFCVQVTGQDGGICACDKGFRATWDGRRCVPERCTLDEHCDLANEVCNTAGNKCRCRALHVRAHESLPCIPPLGRYCTSAGDCLKAVPHSQCSNKTCACEERFVASQDETLCLPLLGAQCDTDEHCQVEHSQCHYGRCACRKLPARYVTAANQTACLPEVPGLLNACSEHSQCVRETASHGGARWCVNHKCLCRFGVTHGNKTCDKRRVLDDKCTYSQQCQMVAHAFCVRGKCACEPGYLAHPIGTMCLPGLHTRCHANDDCYMADSGEQQKVECRDEACVCKLGVSSDGLVCPDSGSHTLRARSYALLLSIAVVLASSLHHMASSRGEVT